MAGEKKVTVRVPDNLHRAAKIKAAKTGITISDKVREGLRKWIESDEPDDTKTD